VFLKKQKLLVGITGASGIPYTIRLLNKTISLKNTGVLDEVSVIYTKNAVKVALNEAGLDLTKYLEGIANRHNIKIYRDNEVEAYPASTSALIGYKMVVIPCSLNTLAKIANGIQDNLLTRAALNILRLRSKLILVIRETPLSFIDGINIAKASLAGAIVLPASPAFYTKPQSIIDLIDFIVGKVFDLLDIPLDLYPRWDNESI